MRNVNFVRGFSSEWLKLVTNRAVRGTTVGFLCAAWVLMGLSAWAMRQVGLEKAGMDPKSALTTICAGLNANIIIILIAVGVLAVTSEYSSHTMRVTTMSLPSRPLTFSVKLTATACFALLAAVVCLAGQIGIGAWLGGFPVSFTDGRWWIFVSVVLCQVLGAVAGLGLGYLMRSSAGAIVTEALVLALGAFLMFIPQQWFQDHILPAVPPIALTNATALLDVPSTMTQVPTIGSFAIWAAWSVGLAVIGLVRYHHTDV
ncbi:hypothetical protein [Neoactinobaculum massilliense]|uniref:hypothetical protein n=1 Tax=Neoactinobaculum massilliense TaxID=2364794 RepID=UPI000F51F9A8|nr:hypothetical protein [Neoactinobaculum massilliense]